MKDLSRKQLLKLLAWLVLLVLTLTAASIGFWQYKLSQPLKVPTAGMVYEVPVGASLQRVARDLEQVGVLDNALWLRIFVKLNPGLAHVRAGEYQLQPGLRLPDLMQLFVSGRVIEYPVQFLEGWTFADVRRELARQPKLLQSTVDMTSETIMESLGRPGTHPEGVFFPDTYLFHKGMSDLDVLQVALRRMDQILTEEWQQRSKNLPLKSPYEALILASIVEKETGAVHERPMIAGVFVRRLQQGMRLQTDPTVIYGLGAGYIGNISKKNLTEETPYNTYVITGLPPTPIALPGREAIHAALHPADGKELFFVARGDGTHEFTETFDQHQRAVVKYQIRERRTDYRSRPPAGRSEVQ